MFVEIKNAKKSIFWEVFILKDDAIGHQFIGLLEEKAKEGLEIKLVLDAFGSFGLSSLSEARLVTAGVEVLWFNRLKPTADIRDWFRRLWQRNHRKVLIIDEETAFVGGVNVHSESENWDDLFLKLKGKVVRSFLYGFAKIYIKAGGSKRNMIKYLHPKLLKLEQPLENIEFFSHSPSAKASRLRKIYAQALNAAKETFTLITPYYVPDLKFLKMIAKAHRRGVKINIILPARTDHKIMNYFARAFFRISTAAGAKMYLLKNMNHSKAFLVDGKSGMVGSGNLNTRSWYVDEEAGVTFSDEKMANDLNNILYDWLGQACLVEPSKKEGFLEKIINWWANKLKDYV